MLITARRRKLDPKGFRLPDWIRAPLSLNSGALAWCVVAQSGEQSSAELIISNFDPVHWTDLWRLEIEILDRMGALAPLIELFESRDIAVLAAEGSVDLPGHVHVMSLILSCVHYANNFDGDRAKRELLPSPCLNDLFNWTATTFINDLNFSQQDEPRLRLSRLNTHWRLSQSIQSGADHRLLEKPLRLAGDYLRIPQRDLKPIQKLLGNDLCYTPTVDTKDRLIRILMFGDDLNSPMYFQFALNTSPTATIKQVTDLLAKHSCNVIKFSIRGGPNKAMKGRGSAQQPEYRLDVTFEPHGRVRDRLEFQGMLVQRLKELRMYRDGRIRILTPEEHSGVRRHKTRNKSPSTNSRSRRTTSKRAG
jgi:hypothetical protein